MKLILLLAVILATLPLAGCKNPLDPHHYITGPQGGCYYNNDEGNKVYVDRSFCS